jgi:Xaa-Pro aminopeptidase
MYPHQTERLTGALDAAGAEALVASTAANVAYVTGWRSISHALLGTPHLAVYSRRGTALVVPAPEVPAAVAADDVEVDHVGCFGAPDGISAEAGGPLARRVQAIVSQRAASPGDALAGALAALGVRDGPIALDDARLSADDRQRITVRLGTLRVVSGSAHLGAARRVKAPFEIECLAGALRIAEEALNEVVQMLKRGVMEREATSLYLTEIIKRGGEPIPSSIALGDRTALGAAWPSDRAIRPGELVRLDVGCTHRGYAARVGRTAVLGEPTPEQDSLHGAIQSALEAAIEAAAPGRPAGGVYEAAGRALRERGLTDDRGAEVGHGIGLELRELPWLAAGAATPLEAGEVLSIELAHAGPGRHGFLARDTVLVTAGGARVLNRSARGLVILD